MPKVCPSCGNSFGDNAVYCDRDGTPLNEVKSGLAGIGLVKLALGAVVLIAALYGWLILPKQMQRYVHDRVTVRFAGVELPPPTPVDSNHRGVRPPALLNDGFGVRLRVQNNCWFGSELVSGRWKLTFDDVQVAGGEWPERGDPRVVPGDSSKEMLVLVRFSDPGEVWSRLSRRRPAGFPLHLDATASVKVVGFTRTSDFGEDIQKYLPRLDDVWDTVTSQTKKTQSGDGLQVKIDVGKSPGQRTGKGKSILPPEEPELVPTKEK